MWQFGETNYNLLFSHRNCICYSDMRFMGLYRIVLASYEAVTMHIDMWKVNRWSYHIYIKHSRTVVISHKMHVAWWVIQNMNPPLDFENIRLFIIKDNATCIINMDLLQSCTKPSIFSRAWRVQVLFRKYMVCGVKFKAALKMVHMFSSRMW